MLRPPVWGDLSVWPQETLPVDVAVSSRKWEGQAGLVQLARGLRGHRAHVHTQLCSPQPHPLLVSTRPRTEGPGRGLARCHQAPQITHLLWTQSRSGASQLRRPSSTPASAPLGALRGLPARPSLIPLLALLLSSGCGRVVLRRRRGAGASPRTPPQGRAELYSFLIKAPTCPAVRLEAVGCVPPQGWAAEANRSPHLPTREKGRNQCPQPPGLPLAGSLRR